MIIMTSFNTSEVINKINQSRSRSNSKNHTHQNRARSKSRSKLDYNRLGISDICLRCGRNNHRVQDCRCKISALKCNSCQKTGHVSKVCISTLLRERKNRPNSTNTNAIDTEDDEIYQIQGIHTIVDVYRNKIDQKDAGKYFTTVKIQGQNQQFEIDSGAGFTLLPKNQFEKLNLKKKLEKSSIAFRSYTDNILIPEGKIDVEVQYKNVKSIEELYVVPNGHSPLLGRVWIRHLKINLEEIDSNQNLSQISMIDENEDFVEMFHEIFEERIGCVPKFEVKLQLRPNAKPIFTKEREVPYALREKVEKELDNLEASGIISKVSNSDWGSPLVVIPKPDGSVRLCVDYKVGVNERLVQANYPIKKIDEVLNSLRDSRFFCRLDLCKAYLHLKVDDLSSQIQTMSTHRGTYKVNRLSFGVKTAPAEFNRIIDQILSGLPKTVSYFDDIVIHGETKQECKQNLILCLQRLKEYDLHLNRKKCTFFDQKIEYLGHVVEYNRISKNPRKVEAITKMPRPKNLSELERFLGMITYYTRFIPDVATITYPLRLLKRKGKSFVWSTECELAFLKLKNEIASDRVLIPYNPELPVILACDASPFGIAAVLSHITQDGERPIAFASRSLSPAESNYSQLDREALAIVFGTHHFFIYIFGRRFKLRTDNQPLTRIFHQNNKLPAMTSARLLRYATFLSGFDYEIEFKKGSDHPHVDCLSRAPIIQNYKTTDMALNDEVHELCAMNIFEISTATLNSEIIVKETEKDEELSKIKTELINETSNDNEYLIDDGILFKNNRVMIPKALQKQVLEELHSTHVGITKMKQLARRYCTWKTIDKDIEHTVKSCVACAGLRTNPAKAPLHQWDLPEANWDRIHIDYAGPFQGYNFLIVVDAKSRWPEIKILKPAPTSESTIELLNDIFSIHGYPRAIVSDNATIFTSENFKNYCKEFGIVQKFIAPGHPATNGLAERHVRTSKNRIRAMENEPDSMYKKIRKILFRHRALPLVDGKSPAELYLNRQIRIKLDALKIPKNEKSTPSKSLGRQLSINDRVQARFFQNNKSIWKFGTITKKLGKLHYIITLDEGRSIKRHINQLLKSEVPKKRVTFAEVDEPVPGSSHQGAYEEYELLPQEVSPPVPVAPDIQVTTSPRSQREEIPEEQREAGRTEESSSPPRRREVQSAQPLRRSSRTRRSPSYLKDYVT